MVTADPYKVLQVDPDAEPEVIRAAYRALALKYHPDVATGSQARMSALNHAWGILRDAGARSALDHARAEARAEARARPAVRQPEVSHEMRAPTAAPAQGPPSGSVLDFGRYVGWSLGQIAASDPEYLEWLARTPIGRSFNRQISELLAKRASTAFPGATTTTGQRQRRHRH